MFSRFVLDSWFREQFVSSASGKVELYCAWNWAQMLRWRHVQFDLIITERTEIDFRAVVCLARRLWPDSPVSSLPRHVHRRSAKPDPSQPWLLDGRSPCQIDGFSWPDGVEWVLEWEDAVTLLGRGIGGRHGARRLSLRPTSSIGPQTVITELRWDNLDFRSNEARFARQMREPLSCDDHPRVDLLTPDEYRTLIAIARHGGHLKEAGARLGHQGHQRIKNVMARVERKLGTGSTRETLELTRWFGYGIRRGWPVYTRRWGRSGLASRYIWSDLLELVGPLGALALFDRDFAEIDAVRGDPDLAQLVDLGERTANRAPICGYVINARTGGPVTRRANPDESPKRLPLDIS